MSAIFLFSALDCIGAPIMAWVAAIVCAAIDFYILYLVARRCWYEDS